MRVLVALDDSPISLRAGREAARLFPGADFLIVNVTSGVVPWVMAGWDFGGVYPAALTGVLVEGPGEDQVAAWADTAGLGDAEVLAVRGDAATVICDAAEQHDVDVVVVGSHDKGVLRRLFDPSVAHAVVQGTYRPVLVVSGAPPAP